MAGVAIIAALATLCASLVMATPLTSSPSYCGKNIPGVCANQSHALSYPYAEYQNTKGFITLSECRKSCLEKSECQSYEFFYQPAGQESLSGSFYCYLYSVPVSKYTSSCNGAYGVTPLKYFYNKDCPHVPPATSGKVPPTCQKSYCYPNGEPNTNLYPDLLVPYLNIDYSTCIGHCNTTKLCKSVFYGYAPLASEKNFTASSSTDSSENSLCVLISQPVLSYLNRTQGGATTVMDKHCPIGGANYDYVFQGAICGNGTTPHTSS